MVDELVTDPLYGNYRAKVVENRDKEKFGRVMVWIPDIMPLIPDTKGLWARPANNPMGGRNKPANIDYAESLKPPRRSNQRGLKFPDQDELNLDFEAQDNFYAGSSYVPPRSSWVWVFFEAGNINRPYYFGALDLENTTVLAENAAGDEYQAKWTIFKSHAGRTIVISDDPGDERVEITGKKRLIANPPSGDEWSVYAIDKNQTTILLDEREGKEKILIRTYKGDFIHLDIDDQDLEIQMAKDIHIKCGGNFYLSAGGEIHVLSGKSIMMTAKDEYNLVSGHRMNIQSGEEYNRKVNSNSVEQVGGTKITHVAEDIFIQSEGEQHTIAGGDIFRDANEDINDNSGLAQPSDPVQIQTIKATPATPEGERKT